MYIFEYKKVNLRLKHMVMAIQNHQLAELCMEII